MFIVKKWLIQQKLKRNRGGPPLPLAVAEQKHKNPDQPLFNDSSYFNGFGQDGAWFVVRQSFRTTRGNEFWLKLFFPGKGEFALQALEGPEGTGFSQGPLSFECIEPGKRWSIRYQGPIHQGDTEHQLDMALTFTGMHPLVDFKDGANQAAIARTIARAKWTRPFFQKLRDMKKTHLEQAGQLTGTISLDGQAHAVNWTGVRDHSWGIRKWGNWQRHIWMSALLDNGEAFNFSTITYDFLGQLAAGYLTSKGQVNHLVEGPAFSDFAEEPLIPKEGSILLQYDQEQPVELTWTLQNNFSFSMDNEYNIFEGMAHYTLGGVPGKGVAEFGLNPRTYDLDFDTVL